MAGDVYFETSAINYLLDFHSEEEIIFIRDALRLIPNRRLFLSPVTLWEIGCTRDDARRDALIRTCQVMFDEVWVYPGPMRILDHFIEEGCPKLERKQGFLDNSCTLHRIWEEVSKDTSKTLLFKGSIFSEDGAWMKEISKTIGLLIKQDYQCNMLEDENAMIACQMVNYIYPSVHYIREKEKQGKIDERLRRIYKTAVLFIWSLLIMGMSIDGYELKEFWEKRKVSMEIVEQWGYLLAHCQDMIFRGPIAYMAVMAVNQMDINSNRGLYKDCLHTMYMPYCDVFFTNDKHFIELKESERNGFWGRISSIKDFCRGILKSSEGG